MDEDDLSFHDALDDFPSHDCSEPDQCHPSTCDSTLSVDLPFPEVYSSVSTIRRRSISRSRFRDAASEDSTLGSSSDGSSVTQVNDPKTDIRERRYKIDRALKENEKNLESSESAQTSQDIVEPFGTVSGVIEEEDAKTQGSIVTVSNDDLVGGPIDSGAEDVDSTSSNLLVSIVGLVFKAIGFQLNLLFTFVSFPAWVLYHSYMLVVDPFGVARRVRQLCLRKLASLCSLIGRMLGPFVNDWLKDQKTIWKFFLTFVWGFLWSIYVCTILFGLLVLSVLISGFLMRYLVEEPMQIRQGLNFDYTKNSPVAYVPISSRGSLDCGVNGKDNDGDIPKFGPRPIPPNHKLQVDVSLTLPESEYNRNLGMFQVRVVFLSANGKTLASKSQPCMLKFQSQPIRILLTFLKIAPLVAGYISESQTLELKIKGFTEGVVPTSCLKVVIEQRAAFLPGAGIPELYEASLVLQSELPFFSRIIWCWRKTLFVWTSIMLFMMEFLFILICCTPLVIPRTRPRDVPASFNTNGVPEQS
ncbi:hypothetical protein K2173_006605 [Erythroxylum novogranatense]|uniref:Seipin n=1 Tax=Erythroxylum novogranatense TaxID=1862640 RepID=A0AAV8T700_9ROSI|nr:hypothetical protein K2173_006605 [Erythroxylum novogranatense]